MLPYDQYFWKYGKQFGLRVEFNINLLKESCQFVVLVLIENVCCHIYIAFKFRVI